MNKTSGGFGLVLALVSIAGGFSPGGGESRVPLAMALGVGAALILFAVLTLLGRRWAQVLLSITGLGMLGWFLPVYFRTSEMWPYLAFIILGSATFGLGILGVLLDAYETRDSGPL